MEDLASVEVKRRRRARKRRKTIPLDGWRPLTSAKAARRVTSEFHRLTRELEELRKERIDRGSKKRIAREATLEQEIEGIGGQRRYQEASVLLTSTHKTTAKWVFKNLTEQRIRPKKGEPPLRLLEVGAVNAQLLSCPWLDVFAIDLKSRHPHIKEMNFFDLEMMREGRFDVICNAMVLNCVPTAEKRGEMLYRCSLLLKNEGLLLLRLPIRCFEGIGEKSLENLFFLLGLEILSQAQSPKIWSFALRKVKADLDRNALIDCETLLSRDGRFALSFSPAG